MTDMSLWNFIVHATFTVKIVLVLLIIASIISWAIIFQRFVQLRAIQKSNKQFHTQFLAETDFQRLYRQCFNNQDPREINLPRIFQAAWQEFTQSQQHAYMAAPQILDNCQRAMEVAQTRSLNRLEKHLDLLATIGSTSPYIGLFGTVWGIMNAFQSLGSVQQASLPMVAPGIAEALIATAIGLFAAIPAVMAYNRFTHQLEFMAQEGTCFQEEAINILSRQIQTARQAQV